MNNLISIKLALAAIAASIVVTATITTVIVKNIQTVVKCGPTPEQIEAEKKALGGTYKNSPPKYY